MQILALDTTMQACSVAYLKITSDGTPESHHHLFQKRERGHAEALAPMLAQLITQAEISLKNIDRIAVTLGPGTFTGIRIGVAAARGLGLSLKRPVVGLSSLHVLAVQALNSIKTKDVLSWEHTHIIATSNARRGQIYMQICDAQANPITGPKVCTPEQALEHVLEQQPEGKVLYVGTGGPLIKEALKHANHIKFENSQFWGADLLPCAMTLAELAKTKPPSLQKITPLYLRPPDAKPQSNKMLLRQSS